MVAAALAAAEAGAAVRTGIGAGVEATALAAGTCAVTDTVGVELAFKETGDATLATVAVSDAADKATRADSRTEGVADSTTLSALLCELFHTNKATAATSSNRAPTACLFSLSLTTLALTTSAVDRPIAGWWLMATI